MILRVDTQSPVPPYEQIRAQVATMIQAGTLSAGMRLPTVRQLAADLGLAGGTVARAYRELEQAGAIETRGRRGTFVTDVVKPARRDGRERLRAAARAFALEAKQLGAAPREALEVARAELEELST